MSVVILRRRRLGRTSCREIANNMQNNTVVWRTDQQPPQGVCSPDYTVRWGCTETIPEGLKGSVLNHAHAIHEVNDKLAFRKILDNEELCPATIFNMTQAPPSMPCIIRPAKHAQGRQLYVCNNRDEIMQAIYNCTERGLGWYCSEIINKVAEYRVCVVSGRAVWVAKKTPGNPDDIAWNVARGGRFDNVRWDEWPLKVVKYAIKAFNLSELDFGGVDVMVDGDGNCYVLEINSAPSLTSEYRQQCMAKAFDYIVEHGRARIPLIEERGGYRKFIHPSVCDRAILCAR